MSLVRTAGTLATEIVRTAASAARHPISTASLATGLVKGTAEAGVRFVRGATVGESPLTDVTDTVPGTASRPEASVDAPPEPQVVPKPVPEIDELPEPIVITAEDEPGEEFHTEPKAASRDSEHGGTPGDREEVEGYAEEAEPVVDPAAEEPQAVWTSESDPGSGPGA
jgi:hypothetical protein